MRFVTLDTVTTSSTVLITPRYAGQIVRLGSQEVVTEAETPVRLFGTGEIVVSTGFWDELMIVEGRYDGPYRDGSFPGWDWAGVANNSVSYKRDIKPPFRPDYNAIHAWDKIGERYFHTGCEKGMLYPEGGNGVPWNGLTAVKEGRSSETVQPIYQNGIKISETLRHSEFIGTIEAFTYPNEFSKCLGEPEIGQGFYVSDQTPKPFHLSYVTRLGNDTMGEDYAYRLHLVYNALANPSSQDFSTITNTASPTKFSFPFTTVGERLPNNRPAAHLYFDSDKTPKWFMTALEEQLYGTPLQVGKMPTIDFLFLLASSPGGNLFTNPKFDKYKGGNKEASKVEVFKNFYRYQSVQQTELSFRSSVSMGFPLSRRVYIRHMVRSQNPTQVYNFINLNSGLGEVRSELIDLRPNVWTEVATEITAPPNAVSAIRAGIRSTSESIEVKEPVYAQFPTPYFDPDKPSPDPDLDFEWTDVVGASPTALVGYQPAGFGIMTGCKIVISGRMPGRETSLRVIKTSYEDEATAARADRVSGQSELTVTFEAYRKEANVAGKVRLISGSNTATIFDQVDQPSRGGIRTYREYSTTMPNGGVDFQAGEKPGESMWYYGLTYVGSEYNGPIIEGPVI